MARKIPLLVLCALAAACHDSGGGSDGDPTADLPLAAGIRITAIDLYQGVRLPIMLDGEAASPELAPIVGGKDALLRVSVEPDASFEPRDLILRIELAKGDDKTVFTDQMEVTATASTDGNLASTLNFDLPGADLDSGQSIAVSLREVSEDVEQDGDTSGAAWPSDGTEAIDVQNPQPAMQLVIVPVQYDADGSGRLPDTSAEALAAYEDLFMAMYPINGIEITVDDPLPWSQTVSAAGGGWSQLLNAVTQRRTQNGADPADYYFALVAPAATYNSYCQLGCVAGLSWQLTNIAPSNQVGTGIGFAESEAALKASTYTAIHEVGHLHGLLHVDATSTMANQCSTPDAIDQNYPYTTGSIGVWGYNPTDETLKDPSFYKDIMSYCMEVWMSDYSDSRLYERIVAKNEAASATVLPPADGNTTWLSIVEYADGTVELGPTLESDLPIQGEKRSVDLLDASGAVVETIEGAFIPYADLGGGMIVFPAPSLDIETARVAELPAVSLR